MPKNKPVPRIKLDLDLDFAEVMMLVTALQGYLAHACAPRSRGDVEHILALINPQVQRSLQQQEGKK